MDINIKNELGNFKLRVSGIIIKDDKILVHEGKKFNGFCFPGGHIELGETTQEAILREIKEELGATVEIIGIFCINENIYKVNDSFLNQEINYYYKLKLISDLPNINFEITEIDKGIEKKHIFHWLPIKDMIESNLQPIDITRLIDKNINSSNNILLSDYRQYNND